MRGWPRVQDLPEGKTLPCVVCREDSTRVVVFQHVDKQDYGIVEIYHHSREGYSLCDPHLTEFKQKYHSRKIIQFALIGIGLLFAGISYGLFKGTTADVLLYLGLGLMGISVASFWVLPDQVPKKDRRLQVDRGPGKKKPRAE